MTGDGPFPSDSPSSSDSPSLADRPSLVEWASSEVTEHDRRGQPGCAGRE